MVNGTVNIISPSTSPQEQLSDLETAIKSNGITDAEVTLESVDVNCMRFSVQCPDNDENYNKMMILCGALNTTRGRESLVSAQARAVNAGGFQIAGSEGRFAKENPPPKGAK